MSGVPKPSSAAHALPVAARSIGAPSVLAAADDEAANAENSTRVPNPRPTSMFRSPPARDAVACSPSEAAPRRKTRCIPGRAKGGGNNMPHTPEHDAQQSPGVLCCDGAVLSLVGREAHTFDERQFVPGRASFALDVRGSSFTA
jgi:hypothetical protein